MCRRVTCRTCHQPSWAGCGAHVEAVLGDVPVEDRCHCTEQRAAAKAEAKAARADGAGSRGGLFARFRSRVGS